MKKVLYAASTAGHLRSFHLPWLDALKEQGWTVHCAAAGEFSWPSVDAYFDLPFTKSMFSPKNLAVTRQLAKLLRRERYDLVCIHTSLAAFFLRLAVALAGKGETRVVNVVHGYLFDDDTPFVKRTLLLGAEKLTARLTDTVAVMNRQDWALANRQRLSRGGVVMLPGIGLDVSRFTPADEGQRRAARARFGLPENAFVLAYAAEFSARKHQETLIRAMTRLPEDVFLLLPGRGDEWENIRALAAQLGVAERVILPGFLTDVEASCHAADLAVSSSRSEGLPFHLMECMSCGLPGVVTRVKGNEDLIDDDTGRTFPFDDDAALARAVLQLRADEALRRRMGENARRRVLERYTLAQVAPVYTALMEPEREVVSV